MIYKANNENIAQAAKVIKSGGLVAFPTETVYGLGANGFLPEAVAKIFEVKRRPTFNPLILHIASLEQLNLIAVVESEIVHKVIEKFWPGPLTLVLPKRESVPEIVTAGNPTVAVRMPSNKIAKRLIELSGVPIAAPSANVFGFLSPTSAQHVEKQLGKKIEMILDGGLTDVGIESTIIEVTKEKIFLLRPGGVPLEEIEEITGNLSFKGDNVNPNSPGQLKSHYAPRIPLRFFDEVKKKEIADKKLAALFFKRGKTTGNFVAVKILSEKGDLREAAANLFAFLHELENSNAEMILVEKPPFEGLGIAITDRLRRAANKFV